MPRSPRADAIALARDSADIDLCDIDAPVAEVHHPLVTRADVEQTVRAIEALDRRPAAVTADVREPT